MSTHSVDCFSDRLYMLVMFCVFLDGCRMRKKISQWLVR